MATNTSGTNQRFSGAKPPSGWQTTFVNAFNPRVASKWTPPTEISSAAYQKSLEPYKGKHGVFNVYGDRGASSMATGFAADAQTESDLNAATKWAIEKGLIKDPGKIGFAEVAPLLAFAAPAAAAMGLFAGAAAGAGAAGSAGSAGTAAGTAGTAGTAATYGAGTGYAASAGAGTAASGTATAGGTAAAGGAFKLGTLADAASIGAGTVGLLGSGEAAAQPAPVPTVAAEPEPVMPTVDSAAVARARRRSLMAQLARRGRQSTILTDPLGG